MDNRRPLKPEELEAIITEMSDIEHDSDDSEYIPSDDDGEIDIIEGLTDNEGNSASEDDGYSEPDDEDNTELENRSRDSDVNNEDSDDQTNANGQTYVSKNKQVWHETPRKLPQGRLGQQNILREKSGPTRYANREVDSISSAFLIYLRKPLMQIILKWTNVEGNTVFGNKWKQLDESELLKFIGVLILIGVYKSKNEEISQLWSKKNGRKIFNDIMSRTRFQNILRVIRFDNAAERRKKRSSDKLQPIRECFEMWNDYLQDGYIPSWCMTVDEQLVTFRGRCPFRQYIPSKPGRYGIKFWAICDSITSYAWKLEVYTGKTGEKREKNQGENVVMRLVKDIEKSGRNITCDSFFTSYSLANYLLTKNLTIIGTIRKNKPDLPSCFTNPKNREILSTLFGFQNNKMVLSYCPKKGKVVTLLSTAHNDKKVSGAKEKPEVILDYNKTKSGVDTMDKMTRTYSVKRMTRRWPLTVFYNMIDISVMNAFIVWLCLNRNCEKKLRKRRNFIIELGKQLALYHENPEPSEASTSRETEPTSRETEPPRKKSRCSMCTSKKDRKTRTTCNKCKKHVCGEHSVTLCTTCVE